MSARRRTLTISNANKPLGDCAPLDAIRDGRVFVNGIRELRAELVPPAGAIVDVYAARQSDEPVRILGERRGLVAAYKPAAIATEPDRQGASGSLLHEAARLLRVRPDELHASSRLDVGVSGVVLLARKPGPRGSTKTERVYVGIAERAPEPESGVWESAVDGRDALTRYRVIATAGGRALIALRPETGRMHQLRIHAEQAGAPLVGDRAHGGSSRLVLADGSVIAPEGIALHALAVQVGDWSITAPLPERMAGIWARLGGHPDDWERALTKW